MLDKSDSASKLGSLLESFRKKQCAWPDPEASTDRYLQNMGRYRCWEAKGPAREAFNLLAVDIKDHLEQWSEPLFHSTVIWSVCMVGRNRQSSRPTIAFVSHNTDDRKRIRKAIEGSGILLKYPGFITMDCNRPPGFQSLLSLGRGSYDSIISNFRSFGLWPPKGALPWTVLPVSGSYAKRTGLKIYPLANSAADTTTHNAVGGGILECAGGHFLLTAAHPFAQADDAFGQYSSSISGFEYDIDVDALESEDEDDQMVESTSRGSKSPDQDWMTGSMSSKLPSHTSSTSLFSQLSRSSILTAYRVEPTPSEDMNDACSESSSEALSFASRSHASTATTLNPEESGSMLDFRDHKLPFLLCHHSGLDYALLEVTGDCISLLNYYIRQDHDNQELLSGVIEDFNRSQNVLALTATSGPLQGRLSGTPTFMQYPDSRLQVETWAIHMDGKLSRGDCGCWVVDPATGKVFGHLVAGSPGYGTGFIVPLKNIIAELENATGNLWTIAQNANQSSKTISNSTDESSPSQPRPKRLIEQSPVPCGMTSPAQSLSST